MYFAGYSLTALATVFGASAACALVLYVLRLRRRPIAVPFALLWERASGEKHSHRLLSQLKRWLSLLLQLLILALLCLALGDPRLGSPQSEGRNVVLLLDASASMAALDEKPSRLGAAVAAAQRLLEGLGPQDRALVAQMDATVTPLTAMTDDVSELSRSLARVSLTDTAADLPRALRFALDSLSGRSRPEVVLLSDGAFSSESLRLAPPLGEAALSYVPVGSRADNVAITNLSVRRYPLDRSRYEVLLELRNFGDESAEVELALVADGRSVGAERLTLTGGKGLSRVYKNLAGADRRLEARLTAVDPQRDQLQRDNRAFALLPERHRSRILVVGEPNAYLEAALLLDDYLEVTSIAPGSALPPGRFDVTILDSAGVEPEPRLGALFYLGLPAAGPPAPVASRSAIEQFGFDHFDKKSPLLRWIAPENIQVLSGNALEPQRGDSVVGASELGPILVSGERAGQPFVVLGFDPRQSDFVLRVGWPLFVLNTLQHFAEVGGDYVSSYHTGSVWSIPLPGEAQSAELSGPAGLRRSVPVRDGRAIFAGELAGFYEVTGSEAGSGGAPPARVALAANVGDVDESRIRPRAELSVGPVSAQSPAGFTGRSRLSLWSYLLLATLVLSAGEWLSYHRRWTV